MMHDAMMMMVKRGFLFISEAPDYGHCLESVAEGRDPSGLVSYHDIDMMMDDMQVAIEYGRLSSVVVHPPSSARTPSL